MNHKIFGLILFILILLSAAAWYVVSTPKVVAQYPSPGATSVPARTHLELTFSRSMIPETVADRLTTEPYHVGRFSWVENTVTFETAQPWPNGETIHIRLEPGSKANTWFSLPMIQAVDWSFEIESPLIFYLYPANDAARLYTIVPGSGEIELVSELISGVLDFSIHPDGLQIYYIAQQNSSTNRLYRFNRLSGENKLLLEFSQALCRSPSISPQGNYLAYELVPLGSDTQVNISQIWLISLEGEAEVEPFRVNAAEEQAQQPHWSPNGLLTYYNATVQTFIVYDPHHKKTIEIPSQTGIPGTWSADGEDYLFAEIMLPISGEAAEVAGLRQIPTSHLLRFHLKSQALDDLTQFDDLEDAYPLYSPDGYKLLFARKYLDVSQWTPGRQIWMMDLSSKQAVRLTNDPQYNHYDFAWSQDGKQFAFMRFDQMEMTSLPELWVMNSDGSNARLLVKGGYAPQWIP